MKLLTKEEEREHYNATLKGGAVGGFGGLGLGLAAVYVTSMRYQFMRQLTLPLKAFLITSTGTFGGIIYADHYSRAFEQQRNPKDVEYKERQAERAQQEVSGLTWTQRAMQWGKAERYKIVGASWLASMGAAFAIVNRNKYLTGNRSSYRPELTPNSSRWVSWWHQRHSKSLIARTTRVGGRLYGTLIPKIQTTRECLRRR